MDQGTSSETVARVVVALDFGTTFSGFAFAHVLEPDRVYTNYDWPLQARCGGMPYCKTITALFYTRDLKLLSWAWPARQSFTEELHAVQVSKRQKGRNPSRPMPALGHYVTRFKLHLAPKDSAPFNAPDLPPGLTVNRVVSDFLAELGGYVVEHLKLKYGKHMSKQDIQWCMTVPTIWDNTAKEQMKHCMKLAGLVGTDVGGSPFPLTIVLEPEAASMYCCKNTQQLDIKFGDKFLVADIGGGTTDIVVQEKLNHTGSLQVREVAESSGGLHGGTHADRNFINMLQRKISCLEEFLVQNPNIMQILLKWWERTKYEFAGTSSADFQLPSSLARAWEEYDTRDGRVPTISTYDEIELSATDIAECFDPVIDKILELISAQIKLCGKIKILMVVGGFSGSPYLMSRIRGRFGSLVEEIITPPNPGSAVVQGAVISAMNRNAIVSRIAKKTYGICIVSNFKAGDLTDYRFLDSRGVARCDHRFSIFVRKGTETSIDECVVRTNQPVWFQQKSMKITLFSSTSDSPYYTTAEDCRQEGQIVVDMSDTKLDLERIVEVSMFFGRETIEVTAKGVNFGDQTVHRMLPTKFVCDWV